MGHPTVTLVLVVLCLTATLPRPTIGQTEGSSGSTEKATTASIIPTTMSSGSNGKNEFDTRLNRIDNRLDGIEAALSEMKAYLLHRMNAMEEKVEWVMKRQEAYTPEHDRNDGTVTDMPQVYSGCEDVLARGLNTSGVYTIALNGSKSMDVYCEQRLDSGGWAVFQARSNGLVDFDQDWDTYKSGFGNLTEEFWLGNEAIYQLTKQHVYQLKVELTDVDGDVKYADYNQFSVGDENDKYRLKVTGYTGGSVPGDSMRYQHGSQFSTMDQNNDAKPGSCASQHVGGWWYNGCNWAKLNDHRDSQDLQKWMLWWTWKPVKSLNGTRMMMRKIQ